MNSHKTRNGAWLLFFAFIVSCIPVSRHDAFGSEAYYMDNNIILLYKTINWWYDCLPEDADALCGREITYQAVACTRVEYDETKRILKLQLTGGLADQLSIFKECDKCFGPAYLKCGWLNAHYFGNGSATLVTDDMQTIDTFIFKDIGNLQFERIRTIRNDMVFVLEGVIGGLMNGRIALHQAGSFLKTCPEAPDNPESRFPISLKILNSRTNEMLASFSAVFQ